MNRAFTAVSVHSPSAVEPGAFIPVFHRWIQERRVEGLAIDVADYRHVPEGPGVLLVGHEADYVLDLAEGPPGLLYSRKRGTGGPLETRLRTSIHAALVRVVLSEREAAINDVCMYCAGRAVGWKPAAGPNSAGNWTHENPHYSASRAVLCAASAIFSRARGLEEKP